MGFRKYKEPLFMVIRKNGKSTMLDRLLKYLVVPLHISSF